MFINEATKEDFFALALLQRDRPEHAMLKVQHAMGGGVINICENCGDIIHRMSEKVTFRSAGFEFVKPKVESALGTLMNKYGFTRELEENIINNAAYYKMPVEQFRERLYNALDEYAAEFEKLPSYNRAQRIAILVPISVGKRQFDMAAKYLQTLHIHLNSMQEWVQFAHEGLNE